jgi:hypothetical protein
MADENAIGVPFTAQGKAIVGDATAADQRTTLGLGSLAVQNATTLSTTIIPNLDATYELGTSSKKFNAGYYETVYTTSLQGVGSSISASTSIFVITASSYLWINSNDVQVNQYIKHNGDLNTRINFETASITFETGATSRLDINSSGVRLGGANSRVTTILDEDNMVSDSATSLATQQSIKAYVDANAYTLPFTYTTEATNFGALFRINEKTSGGTNYIDFGLYNDDVTSSYTYSLPSKCITGFICANGSFNSLIEQVVSGVETTTSAEDETEQDFYNSIAGLRNFNAFPTASRANSGGNILQGSLSHGSLLSPKAFPASGGTNSGRRYFNVGTGGLDNASGFSLADDTLYCFPFFLPRANYSSIELEIETADSTATLDYSIWYPRWDASTDRIAGNYIVRSSGSTYRFADVSTTGTKSDSFTSMEMSGWIWVALRADNINTALSLGISSNVYEHEVQKIFGGSSASAARTVGYGYSATGVPSMPFSMPSTFSLITSPVALALTAA